ncbi:hypothetical protein AB0A69_11915 [Streptomyces sp. NPDC045431]|uniref:hypothetical protein n=1 Tax=Streptomyces sp. NPDC045431 TaxID=3155613 RepID=UPI0033FA3F75
MSRQAASELAAPGWRTLDRGQMLELRRIKQLLAPPRHIAHVLREHPRSGEFEAWRRLVPQLP